MLASIIQLKPISKSQASLLLKMEILAAHIVPIKTRMDYQRKGTWILEITFDLTQISRRSKIQGFNLHMSILKVKMKKVSDATRQLISHITIFTQIHRKTMSTSLQLIRILASICLWIWRNLKTRFELKVLVRVRWKRESRRNQRDKVLS